MDGKEGEALRSTGFPGSSSGVNNVQVPAGGIPANVQVLTTAPFGAANTPQQVSSPPPQVVSTPATQPGISALGSISAKRAREGSEGSLSLKPNKPKKDRSKLRKGKWTVEEEEYTSRIIHYFSTGLLTLPEGATLRSYLADKLNCDPMRITKKYAGASCLGRRAYHFRNRVHPSVAEIQVARTELDHLEQRFRLRIEGGNPTSATSTTSDLMQTLAQSAAANPFLLQNAGAGALPTPVGGLNPLQTLLLGLAASQNGSSPVDAHAAPAPQASVPLSMVQSLGFHPALLQAIPGAAAAQPPATTSNPVPAPAVSSLAQLLLPKTNSHSTIASSNQTRSDVAPSNVDPALANWAFTQAAASLGPALSQLAAANLQQISQPQQSQVPVTQPQAPQPAPTSTAQQQQASLQQQIQEQQAKLNQLLQLQQNQQRAIAQATKAQAPPAAVPQTHTTWTPAAEPIPPNHDGSGGDKASDFAAALKKTFDLHLNASKCAPAPMGAGVMGSIPAVPVAAPQPSSFHLVPPPRTVPPVASVRHQAPTLANIQTQNNLHKQQDLAAAANSSSKPRTEEDKAAGTALLGFLSSLRKSYEDALRDKEPATNHSIQNMSAVQMSSSRGESSDSSNRMATVTDSTDSHSQQPESSVEDDMDWNSDKKTDPSSSEDSEGERVSKGPPRKRYKASQDGKVSSSGTASGTQ